MIHPVLPKYLCYLDCEVDGGESLLVLIGESRVQLRSQGMSEPGQHSDVTMSAEDVEEIVAEMIRQVPDQGPLHVTQRLLLK